MNTTQEHLLEYKQYFMHKLIELPIQILDEELFDKSSEANGFTHGHIVKRLWSKIYNTAPATIISPEEGYDYANNACKKRYGFLIEYNKDLPWN